MALGGYVYMLSNKKRGVIYTGVTADLRRRMFDHRNGVGSEFVWRYRLNRLVWYARCDEIETAIVHEKRIKRWRRAWKCDLIETENPHWRDLYSVISSV